MSEQNIQKSLRFILLTAQIFGFFPLQNVFNLQSPPKFKWLSIRTLSSLISIVGATCVAIGHFDHMIRTGFSQFEMNGIVFYGCGVFSTVIFIKLAMQWPQILSKWRAVDAAMSDYGWPARLNARIWSISLIFFLLEALEHFAIQIDKFTVAVGCRNGSVAAGFAHFSVNMSFPMIFRVVPYHPLVGILFQLINTRMAFSWTFNNVFVIVLGCALAQRFRQVNGQIKTLKRRRESDKMAWGRLRTEWGRLCDLCHFIDDRVSSLILISYLNNFYFLIFQVFETMSVKDAPVLETVYYSILLFLLILRVVFVTYYCSWVYEESKAPILLLAGIRYDCYNSEVGNFVEMVYYQRCCFTGKGLFFITKPLILKIASAAVTYELVVIQLFGNQMDERKSRNSFC